MARPELVKSLYKLLGIDQSLPLFQESEIYLILKNVTYRVDRLKTESTLLIPLCESGELMIVGAEYDLKSGEVDFSLES